MSRALSFLSGAAALVITLGASPIAGLAERCETAGGAVEVRASVAGATTLTVSYTLVNKTRVSLSWLRIGAGGSERTPVVPQQTPAITSAPPGWGGVVVYPEETSTLHLWWEAKPAGAVLAPGATISGFVVQAPGPSAVRPGLHGMDGRPVKPIDFATLPFTAGGTSGQCWWGTIRSATSSR